MEETSNDRRRRTFSAERSLRGCCQADLTAVRSHGRAGLGTPWSSPDCYSLVTSP
jgi:hypothetical protein